MLLSAFLLIHTSRAMFASSASNDINIIALQAPNCLYITIFDTLTLCL